MARTETTRVTYETLLMDGPREMNLSGVILNPGDPDEPFKVRLVRYTHTDVNDGRGRNHEASSKVTETVAEIDLKQAGKLAQALVEDLAFASAVAERRILTPERPHMGTRVVLVRDQSCTADDGVTELLDAAGAVTVVMDNSGVEDHAVLLDLPNIGQWYVPVADIAIIKEKNL